MKSTLFWSSNVYFTFNVNLPFPTPISELRKIVNLKKIQSHNHGLSNHNARSGFKQLGQTRVYNHQHLPSNLTKHSI